MKIQKLVRDKIPDIIKKSGRVAQVQCLDEKEYYAELQKKLTEEVNEFLAEPCLAELADITELVHALTKILGYDISDLEEERIKKKAERGAFDNKIFLESVD